MKRLGLFTFIFVLISISSASETFAQVDPNLNSRLQNAPIIVDHNSLPLFEQIPDITTTDHNNDCVDDTTNVVSYFCRAEKIDMIFGNRSVGWDTTGAISCLSHESDEACRTNGGNQCINLCLLINHPGRPPFHSPASSVNWYRRGGLDRSRWIHEFFYGTSAEMTRWYIELLSNVPARVQPRITTPTPSVNPRYLSDFDVFTFQFSYLNVGPGDKIDDQPGGFLYNNSGDFNDVYDLEQRTTQYNDKYFIYQTSSLSRLDGSYDATNFNDQMRNFVRNSTDSRGFHRILLDFADIESHDPWTEAPCYDTRDGQEYCQVRPTGDDCENYPDDGNLYPAICQHYTTETINGHFGMSSIKIRVAKAYWITLAQIAGWRPGVTTTVTVTPAATSTQTPSPTTVQIPGDTDGDGDVDGIDYTVWLGHYGQNTTSNNYSFGNFNSDTRVDGLDYVIWLSNYSG